MTDFRKLFNYENVKDIYTKIMKEGYKSNGAGDMWEPLYRADDLASAMQSILNEALDKATVVYCYKPDEETTYLWSRRQGDQDTHKALLIQVEPIKECEHPLDDIVVISKDDKFGFAYYKCSKCNKELVPTAFKVKE